MSDALGTGGGIVSAVEHRLALAGSISPVTSTLDVRTGVLVAPNSLNLVTGTSTTGTMTVTIAAHHWVTARSTADGVYIGAKEAAGTVNIAAAPGSNSRIDVVYSKQNDTGSTVSPDTGTTQELYGVVTGTAAVSPTKPPLPVGAIEVATVTVAAGATNTLGAGVTISNTARQVVARGAPIPVRNQAERDALTAYPMLTVNRLDTGNIEVRNAGNTAWQTLDFVATTPSFSQSTAIPGITIGASWTVSNLYFARFQGQLFVNGSAGRPSWLNGETILTLPVGWRPQRATEWLARINGIYYVLTLATTGALGIFVDNSAGTIQGSGTGVDDTFAVIGSPTLLA